MDQRGDQQGDQANREGKKRKRAAEGEGTQKEGKAEPRKSRKWYIEDADVEILSSDNVVFKVHFELMRLKSEFHCSDQVRICYAHARLDAPTTFT